ncbi:MAG: FAD binding domain-containing protein [Spirochaetia bacterium]|jgi:CO/xanthine dehydrogenase FAD-binding subunit|nr:FAD binding domain-containing protein [Spirochaetia bacterium]
MVKEYARPASIDECLELLAQPGALALAGGTWAMAFEGRDKPERVVDLAKVLPRSIERVNAGTQGLSLSIGAGMTFQELIESDMSPAVIKAAAASMANRNVRNRATVGGNLGANKSCASLVPILLTLGASIEFKERGKAIATSTVGEWLVAPRGIVLRVLVPLGKGLKAASLRSSRTACDIATSTAACNYRLEGGIVKELHVAIGGFGPHAALRPDISALFEGKALPAKTDIEKALLPLLKAKADIRGSAEYKEKRGASLIADALHAAEDLL